MITPQEQALLNRLLRRAHPTELQQELIARLQRAAGIPVEPGPAAQRFQENLNRQRVERARLSILGAAGQPELRFHYTRIVEVVPRSGRGRRGRYNTIRVDSPVPLVGVGLDEAFRLRIEDFRRLIGYAGPMWYANPLDSGLSAPNYYTPFDDFEDYDFEPPFDVVESERYEGG